MDKVLAVTHGGLTYRLVVAARSSGQPLPTAQTIGMLKLAVSHPDVEYPVFQAPQISDRAAAMCDMAGVGYLDLTGRCRLAFGSVYIEVGPGKPLPREPRGLRSLYTAKGTRAIRAMLSAPRKQWTVIELAKEVQISSGQASNVKKLLEEQLRLTFEDGQFRINEPEEVLREWSQQPTPTRDRRHGFYSFLPDEAAERRLVDAAGREGVRVALRAFSAAARYAPMVRGAQMSAYCDGPDGSIRRLAEAAELKSVASGANVELVEPADAGVFFGQQVIDGLPVICPVQAYIDVARSKSRGAEAAEAILERALRETW